MQTEYDIAIIVAAIQGCASRKAWQAEGFRPQYREKINWGNATPSKPAKLILGGYGICKPRNLPWYAKVWPNANGCLSTHLIWLSRIGFMYPYTKAVSFALGN